MFKNNEALLADNRTLIAINPNKAAIDRNVKNGTIQYVGDTHELYLTIPRSLVYGEYNKILTADINGVVRGNYTFKGENIIVDAANMSIEDAVIELNRGDTGAGVTSGKAGLSINRGSLTAASLIWEESEGAWKAGKSGAEFLLLTPDNAISDYVAYTNASAPTIDTVKEALDDLIYKAPVVTSFTSSITEAEIGSTVNNLTLTWVLNKPYITSQSLNNGVPALTIAARNQVLSGLGLTANRTYTLTVNDERGSTTANVSITFKNKVHYGVHANSSLTSAELLTLTGAFATSRTQSRTFDCSSGNKYYYIAFPTSFGTPTFKVNGATSTAFVKTTITHTNASGYASSYDIYRSLYPQNGSGIIVDVT